MTRKKKSKSIQNTINNDIDILFTDVKLIQDIEEKSNIDELLNNDKTEELNIINLKYQELLNNYENNIIENNNLNLKIKSLLSIIESKDMMINSLDNDIKNIKIKDEFNNDLLKKQQIIAVMTKVKFEDDKKTEKIPEKLVIRRKRKIHL